MKKEIVLFVDIVVFLLIICGAITSLEDDYNQTMMWGSYRPGVFFGMKTRSKKPFITGLMWNRADTPHGIQHIRHQSEMNQHISYGWEMHDGRTFGVQSIVDRENAVNMTTEMIKHANDYSSITKGGDWRVRISGKQTKESNLQPYISLAFYFGFENDDDASFRVSGMEGTISSQGLTSPIILTGENEDLGLFSVYVKDDKSPEDAPEISRMFNYLGAKLPPSDVWKIKDVTQQLYIKDFREKYSEQLKHVTSPEKHEMKPIFAKLPNQMEEKANVFVIQKIVKVPFQLDIAFLSDELHPDLYSLAEVAEEGEKLVGERFTEEIAGKKAEFEKNFAAKFLHGISNSPNLKEMAMFALSNMIGSVGYFYGDSFHKFGDKPHIVANPYPLFSAVPARSFFPRGFLWDEGFHQLLISRWDREISKDIISHWFNTMTSVGWIPREQILGDEARSRVPQEFQVQHDTHANPPMLFITMHNFLKFVQEKEQNKLKESGIPDVQIIQELDSLNVEKEKEYLRRMYPLLVKHYKWIVQTQKGSAAYSFRWRGRTPGHTLASGLDDYPRGNEEPQTSERHLDLLCWVYMMTDVLQQMRDFLNIDRELNDLRETLQGIRSNFKSLHWNTAINWYSDYAGKPGVNETRNEYSDHIGYVSLFPFLLGLVDIESEEIGTIFDYIHDKKYLWTDYGLRSLSASDPLAGSKENYWRGPIWMNINYLTLRALKMNIVRDSPTMSPKVEENRQRAKQIYSDLRKNLVTNLKSNFARSKTIFEQYNPFNGKGERAYPFTGWSSLIVLILGELY